MSMTANELHNRAVELSIKFDERFLELARMLRKLKSVDPERFQLCVHNCNISLRNQSIDGRAVSQSYPYAGVGGCR